MINESLPDIECTFAAHCLTIPELVIYSSISPVSGVQEETNQRRI
jgi:hypothetical protein